MSKKLIHWSDSYSVGYSEIDDQHKKLVEMINQLYEAFLQGKADSITGDIIQKMMDYTILHFTEEEKFFEKHNYPGRASHIAEHRSFVERIEVFRDDFRNESMTISYEIMHFLRDWLISHIQDSDKEYSKYFKSKAIKRL